MTSDNERDRLHATLELCPCHGSWEDYGRHLADVKRLQKDPSIRVRKAARHVETEAFVLESIEAQRERRAERIESASRRRQDPKLLRRR